MLFPKPVGNTAIESFLSNTFCIISFCSYLSCRWNFLSCRIHFISSSMWFVCCLHMQIIWHTALSSSHHAMRCCHYSVSIAISRLMVVRDSSVVRRHYIFLLEPSNVRVQYIRKTADLPHQPWVPHISTFRGYRILLTIRNPYINRFTNHFSIHS